MNHCECIQTDREPIIKNSGLRKIIIVYLIGSIAFACSESDDVAATGAGTAGSVPPVTNAGTAGSVPPATGAGTFSTYGLFRQFAARARRISADGEP